jgi:hypothetical protein
MEGRRIRSAIKALALGSLLLASGVSAQTRIESGYNRLKSAEQNLMNLHPSDAVKASAIRAAYDEFVGPAQRSAKLRDTPEEDLRLLYSSARLAAFYTLDEKYVAYMAHDADELARRRNDTTLDLRETYEAFLGVRNFAAAKAFLADHPEIGAENVPGVSGNPAGGAPAVLTFTESGIARRSLDLKSGLHVVVVGHPTCHFTQAAVDAIEKDDELRALLGKYATWVAPQDLRFTSDLYRSWNRSHPGQALSLVDKRQDWPASMDDWSTPTFYFFNDGKLRATVVGWPATGRRKELLDAFSAIGLPNSTVQPEGHQN